MIDAFYYLFDKAPFEKVTKAAMATKLFPAVATPALVVVRAGRTFRQVLND